ncbi:class I SAM-dependent methyltransferase [Streptomyces sp. NPDC088116]|uniref:class I SAM-dependent methyltransferase n=1 Tax=Streptomyces sp. NPDC088116 TaxID=3365825 RepID=UPI0038280055
MKVTLTGAAETLLAPLYARAVDARSAHPLLADPTAAKLLDSLDYDFSRLGIRSATAIGVALRARFLDRRTQEFLAAHPDATVLHLGCGLDSRVERVAPGPGVNWFDVDQPEVIDLRARLYAPRPGHRTIAASVTDADWLTQVPRDLPVLVVAEGLTMYLPADEGPRMLRNLVGYFPQGEMVFDSYSRFAVRMTRPLPVFRQTGARLNWGIDDPRELERAVPGLRLIEAARAFDTADRADVERLPRAIRFRLRFEVEFLSRLPVLRRIGHISRYAFGS